jgi:hypothetical protein
VHFYVFYDFWLQYYSIYFGVLECLKDHIWGYNSCLYPKVKYCVFVKLQVIQGACILFHSHCSLYLSGPTGHRSKCGTFTEPLLLCPILALWLHYFCTICSNGGSKRSTNNQAHLKSLNLLSNFSGPSFLMWRPEM